jgi:hypothetical protein
MEVVTVEGNPTQHQAANARVQKLATELTKHEAVKRRKANNIKEREDTVTKEDFDSEVLKVREAVLEVDDAR